LIGGGSGLFGGSSGLIGSVGLGGIGSSYGFTSGGLGGGYGYGANIYGHSKY
jgi:hypothetical protein